MRSSWDVDAPDVLYIFEGIYILKVCRDPRTQVSQCFYFTLWRSVASALLSGIAAVCRVAPVWSSLVTVRVWNDSSGSDFQFRQFLC